MPTKGVFLDLLGERTRGGNQSVFPQVTVPTEDSRNPGNTQITSVDDGLTREVTQRAEVCAACGGTFPDEGEIYLWAGASYHEPCMPDAARRVFRRDEAMLRALGFTSDEAQPARMSGSAT